MSDDRDDLDASELPSTEATPKPSDQHDQIGPYRLLQKIGEGGMGEVWQAEQSEPVRRTVALKIIKRGMDTKQVVARFEAERQALALMDHPAVAKVFDAGATPRGRPYFVMEHVQGVPITEYCDRHKLSNPERLALFSQVCEGVQHAHQKGVIHRDLKPSNVLVGSRDGKPAAKIIDFGVAKATAQKLTEKTMFTELGVLIGTPEYMSPEQAEVTGEDVDTRTDVYSLGVMLYELLTGALPFDSKELRSGGFEGIRRKIREEEPPRPSARLSTLGDERSKESAARRQIDLPALRSQLRDDLDWIVMRALEKDRTRRYGSPSELAADVGRHLKHEPVLAGPPSAVYRARKFVRRHRFGVGIAAIGIVVLIGFAGTMAVQAARISAERDRANREREASDRVSEFLADMLGEVDPETLGIALWKDLSERVTEVRQGRGATEEETEATLAKLGDALSGVNATDTALHLLDEQVLARAGKTIEHQLVEDPRIAGRLEHTLGETYRGLGLYEAAERHALRAVETRRQALGSEHPDTLQSMRNLASAYWCQGRYDEAEKLHRETLRTSQRVLGPEHPDTLRSMRYLATTYNSQGRYDEAEKLHRETLQIRREVLGSDHPDTLSSMHSLAYNCYRRGRLREAEELYSESLEARRRVLGPEDPRTLLSMEGLGMAYGGQGRREQAAALYRESLEIRRRVLGSDHPSTLNAMNNLAICCTNQGRYEEAAQLARKVLESRRRLLGSDHPKTLLSMNNLGSLFLRQDRYEQAEEILREALDVLRRVLGPEDSETLRSMIILADVYRAQGRYDDVRTLVTAYLESERRRAEISTDAGASNAYAWTALTCEPADLRDPQSALVFALAANEQTGYENPSFLDTLSLAYYLTGDTAKAIENQKRAIALLPEGDPPLRRTLEEALARFEAEK